MCQYHALRHRLGTPPPKFHPITTTTAHSKPPSLHGKTKIKTHILLTKRSLFKPFPFFPPASLGTSVHISLTFSSTMLQCRSNALTRASNLRLLRHEISTCVCERTAVWRIESGPEVNSCSSRTDTSYSLRCVSGFLWMGEGCSARSGLGDGGEGGWRTYVSSLRGLLRSSLRND